MTEITPDIPPALEAPPLLVNVVATVVNDLEAFCGRDLQKVADVLLFGAVSAVGELHGPRGSADRLYAALMDVRPMFARWRDCSLMPKLSHTPPKHDEAIN